MKTRRYIKNDDIITICDSCLRACCWQGIFFCDNYRNSGIVDKTVKELKKLNLEHLDYWKNDLIEKGIIRR